MRHPTEHGQRRTLSQFPNNGRGSDRIRALEQEFRELRQANSILRKASAYFCPGRVRPPVPAMIAVIDAHREVHGIQPICNLLPIAHRPIASMSPAVRSGAATGSCAAGRCAEAGDPSRLHREFWRLRRARGLASAQARRLRGRAMHGGTADAHARARRGHLGAGR